jgi:quinol monooxygenase YgiN
MPAISRYSKVAAKPGMGEELAAKMLEAARALRSTPGCELYIINRVPDQPDVVWVTELWLSREAMEGALASEGAQASIPAVLDLMDLDASRRIDTVPVGGVGLRRAPQPGYTLRRLDELEDLAPKFGMGDTQETRFAAKELGLERTGLGHQRLRPGRRQVFGHRHANAEEIYVVLSGSGRAAIGDEVVDLAPMDALRVAPGLMRAFEAGDDGLVYLSLGARAEGDGSMETGWWAS